MPSTTSPIAHAILAGLQVIAVSGIPTGVFLAVVLVLVAGIPIYDGDHLSLEFFATLSLLDTALVALLIRVFLALAGESSRDVFIGWRPVRKEAVRGLLLVPIVFGAVTTAVVGLRLAWPELHNVADNPLEAFMRTPVDTAIFAVVVILAGGVREELQRAYIIHRFGQRLGGHWVGLGLYSIVFGALHIDQGYDVALAVGALGIAWGVIYIKRRSAVMAMVSHAGFNGLQVIWQVVGKALGI